MFLLEVTWWSHNVLTNLIVGGALDRHPDLQFVFTEQGTTWVPDFLSWLNYFFDRMRNTMRSQEREWGLPIVEKMSLDPGDLGAAVPHRRQLIRPSEVPIREQVGVDRVMRGSDYPHKESSHPFSKEAIRLSFAGVDTVEVQMMLAGNAAALYGFDLDTLAPIGAKIGPVVGEDRSRCCTRLARRLAEVPAFRGSRARHALTEGGRTCRSTYGVGWTDRSSPSTRPGSGTNWGTRSNVTASCFHRGRRVRAPPLVIESDGGAWTLTADGGRSTCDPARRRRRRCGVAPPRDATGRPRRRPGHRGRDADQRDPRSACRTLRPAPRLVAPAARRARRAGPARRRRPRPRRRRRCPPRPGARVPADASLGEMGDFLQRAGYLHIEGVFTEEEMAAVSLDMDRAAPMYSPDRRPLVVGPQLGGRGPPRADAVLRPGLARRRPSGGRRPPVATRRAHRRRPRLREHGGQPHRGPVQAVRRRGGDLRSPVAQGLRARASQLRLLRHDRRHLGDRRRRGLRAAARGRRFPPRVDVAVGPPRAPRPTCRPSTSRRAPAMSPSTCRAPCTSRSRRSNASAGCSTPASGSRCGGPMPSARHASACAPSARTRPSRPPPRSTARSPPVSASERAPALRRRRTMGSAASICGTRRAGRVRAEARAWLEANVPAEPLPSFDTEAGFALHRERERTLSDGRWSAVSWPEEYGGRGADYLHWLIFEEEYYRPPGRRAG